jgi:hypothetical protein
MGSKANGIILSPMETQCKARCASAALSGGFVLPDVLSSAQVCPLVKPYLFPNVPLGKSLD